jgi:hypothetical protein
LQLGVEFLAAASDGIDMQAGDEGKQGIAAVAGFLGLQGSEPAALLLIEATHQEVDLVVELPVGVIVAALALGAGTDMNDAAGHHDSLRKKRGELRRILYGKSWKSFSDAPLVYIRDAFIRNPICR